MHPQLTSTKTLDFLACFSNEDSYRNKVLEKLLSVLIANEILYYPMYKYVV